MELRRGILIVDKEVPYVRTSNQVIQSERADGSTTVQLPDDAKHPRKVVADIVVRKDDMDRLVDVTVCDASCKSYRISHGGAAAEAREADKKTHW